MRLAAEFATVNIPQEEAIIIGGSLTTGGRCIEAGTLAKNTSIKAKKDAEDIFADCGDLTKFA